YYLIMVIAIYMVIELVSAIRNSWLATYFKSCAVLLAAACIAVIPNLSNLWATYEYGKVTTRGPSDLTVKQASTGLDYDYATDYSFGISESFTLLIPEIKGGSMSHQLDKSSATYEALVANGASAQANAFIKNAPTYWGDLPISSGPDYIGAITVFLFILGLLIVRGNLKWWLLAVALLGLMLSWGRHFDGLTRFFFDHIP